MLSLGACHSHDLPEVDCEASEPVSYAELTITSACTSCHSSTLAAADRSGAPVGVDYDSHAAAAENAEHGAEVVNGGSMPPEGGVSTEAAEEFYVWALCGTPP
jgi:uncharacterized membrane protein